MTTPLDLERRVSDWLHSRASATGSARVLASALERVDGIDQQGWRSVRRIRASDRYTWFALAAATVVITVIAVQLLPGASDDIGGRSASASPSSTPRPAPTTYRGAGMPRGWTDVSLSGVRFSVDVPAGWEGFPNYIRKSIIGPQGAEAKIFWTTMPLSDHSVEACHYLRSRNLPLQVARPDPPTGPAAADIAAAVAAVPGTDVVSGPSDITVDGFPAKYVEFVVRDDVGCDPGFFFVYPDEWGGALWPETVPGDTIRVWIVDLGSTRLFIEGATHDDAGPGLVDEVHHIVDSIQFE